MGELQDLPTGEPAGCGDCSHAGEAAAAATAGRDRWPRICETCSQRAYISAKKKRCAEVARSAAAETSFTHIYSPVAAGTSCEQLMTQSSLVLWCSASHFCGLSIQAI